jgi:hypothetical protein
LVQSSKTSKDLEQQSLTAVRKRTASFSRSASFSADSEPNSSIDSASIKPLSPTAREELKSNIKALYEKFVIAFKPLEEKLEAKQGLEAQVDLLTREAQPAVSVKTIEEDLQLDPAEYVDLDTPIDATIYS